jgi:hypothetical protein
MAVPELRLVMPEKGDDRDKAAPSWATSQPPAAEVAPGGGATNGATGTATNGATDAATTRATSPAANPVAGATSETVEGATSPTSPGAETAADPAPKVAADTGALPTIAPIGRPMTAGEKAARLARHWAASAREEAMRPGELVHAAVHGRPESVAQIHAYALSRAWVPEDYEGSLIPIAGAVYAHTIAKGGAALGGSIAWVTARALRLITFAFVTGVLVVLIIAFS